MHLFRVTVALVAAMAVGACASRVNVPPWSSLQKQIEERLVDTTEVTPASGERALLQSALAHAHPQSPLYDRELARDQLGQLVEVSPRGTTATFAGYLLPLLDEVDEWEVRYTELEAEALQQRREAEELTERFATLQSERQNAARDASRFREEIQRLEQELRARDERIHELETTLQRLMNIDLRPSE